MTVREQTAAAVTPLSVKTSTTDGPATSTPSPVPLPDRRQETAERKSESESAPNTAAQAIFSTPKFRLKIQDLDHPGAAKFLSSVNASTVLPTAVDNVVRLLYGSASDEHSTVPPTRSVTLILRAMGGVAYTTGTALDNDHKEIHFSLNYIDSIRPDTRLVHEITGVLTHELVHCFQWDALGTCPGGLIEGVADWVRLNCDLSPLHWKRETDGDWDRGYQHTAYFLEYLEQRFGEGTVRRLNEKLRGNKYQAESFWPELLGKPVEQLYKDYVDKSKSDERDSRQ